MSQATGDNTRPHESMPTARSRCLALLGGPFYLLLLALLFSVVTGVPLAVTMPLVLIGAITIAVVATVLAGRLAQVERNTRRFSLSSAFLAFIPLSIYLAALRFLFVRVPRDDVPSLVWFILALFACAFMLVTTIVLVRMTEAVMWLAVWFVRQSNSRHLASSGAGERDGSRHTR